MKPTQPIAHLAQGFLMGGADIIPGVSGGTVALILGIYERLVRAISHCDTTFLKHLQHREFRAAAERIDLGFVLSLGGGILAGIVSLAGIMHTLLEDHTQHTQGAFFGMILASCWIVSRLVTERTLGNLLLAVLGAIAAWYVVDLPFLESPPTGTGYVFVCGLIAICAMILPGISGSFILLVLGTYSVVTGALRALKGGEFLAEHFVTLGAFAAGCLIGLLSFSRLLRWLLSRHEAATMATLCGVMVGSLRKIWPYKENLSPPGTEFRARKYNNILPDFNSGDTWLTLGILVTAGLLVLLVEWIAVRRHPDLAGELQHAGTDDDAGE